MPGTLSEETALDLSLRHGAAIDGDEGLAGAGALAVNGACDQRLANAAFAFDQHGDRGLRRPAAKVDDPGHGLAGDQVGDAKLAPGRGLHAVDLTLKRVDLQRVLDGNLEALGAHRLHHEVDGAGAHGGDGRFDIAVRGQHDGRVSLRQGPQGRQHRHSAGTGHDEVDQDESMSPETSALSVAMALSPVSAVATA